MNKPIQKNISLLWVLLLAILVLLFFIDIFIGSVYIPPAEILSILTGGESTQGSWYHIITKFRLPRVITAILAGSSLALSGLFMQTYFRNPLAGPFVLGISSGSSLGVALLVLSGGMLGGVFAGLGTNQWIIMLAASAGAGLVLLLILIASTRIKDSMTLLIIGLMFGSATGAIVGILQFFSNAEEIQLFILWTMGNLSSLSWPELHVFLIVFGVCVLLSFTLFKTLNSLLLGENYARSMGIPLKRTRFLIIAVTSLLAGCTTAFCGPIAFIGIAIPHIARMLINTSQHKLLVPATIFSGAIILVLCDIISQLPGSQNILPINAITSLMGAPVIIWVILRRKNYQKTFAG